MRDVKNIRICFLLLLVFTTQLFANSKNFTSKKHQKNLETQFLQKIPEKFNILSQSFVKIDNQKEGSLQKTFVDLLNPHTNSLKNKEKLLRELQKKQQKTKIDSLVSSKSPIQDWSPKKTNSQRAALHIIDESLYSDGFIAPLKKVNVYWIHPHSQLKSLSNKKGYAVAPYAHSMILRYIVSAPGYLPALGYAIQGEISPVLLYREEKLSTILKTLNYPVKSSKSIVIGKILDENYRGIPEISILTRHSGNTQTNYSLGAFGIFNNSSTKTGKMGDFILNLNKESTLNISLHKSDEYLPGFSFNTIGLQGVFTTTLQIGEEVHLASNLVDSMSFEKAHEGSFIKFLQQQDVYTPNSDGIVELEPVFVKNAFDVYETHAKSYQTTLLTATHNEDNFPNYITLYTEEQLDKVLDPYLEDTDFLKGIVIGHLSHKKYHKEYAVKVFNNYGQELIDVDIIYFDENNLANIELEETDAHFQNFSILGLRSGEYHALIIDPDTQRGVSIQSFRTQAGAVTQLEF